MHSSSSSRTRPRTRISFVRVMCDVNWVGWALCRAASGSVVGCGVVWYHGRLLWCGNTYFVAMTRHVGRLSDRAELLKGLCWPCCSCGVDSG
jgi:hypothetical protein